MPALFVFLLKVNAALIVFCLGYYLVLRRLTFYTLNRIYLFIAIIFSSAYPLINLNNFALRHQEIAMPVQTVILRLENPATALVTPITARPDYWGWAEVLFWTGAALFAIRLLIQLAALYKLYQKSRPGMVDEQPVRIIDADVNPFSFWQSIYINPKNLDPTDLKSVLQHEQVHVKEWHTLDILLTEISVIFYWFNPGVWLMKKAVRENIEFITDRKILQQGMDSKQYQYSLLNVSFASNAPTGITNNFNFSTLKKRIIMMNARQSSGANLVRYAFLVPVVLMSLCAFTFSKAELVKPISKAYKTISASVKSLNLIPSTNPDNTITHKKPTYRIKITDALSQISEISDKQLPLNNLVDTPKKITFTFTKQNTPQEINIPLGVSLKNEQQTASGQIHIQTGEQIDIRNFRTDTSRKWSIGLSSKSPYGIVITDTNGNKKMMNVTNRQPIYSYNVIDTDRKKTDKPAYNNKTGAQIDVRGYSSKLFGKDAPLFIIDGVERSQNDFSRLDPKDIVSFSVLKDATAAIYGLKATNGVILVITKHNPTASIITSLQAQKAAPINKDNIQSVNLDDGPTKLILINGKQATEKEREKLPLSDIKSIRVTTDKDNEVNDQYGAKAKNGVIFITTKTTGK